MTGLPNWGEMADAASVRILRATAGAAASACYLAPQKERAGGTRPLPCSTRETFGRAGRGRCRRSLWASARDRVDEVKSTPAGLIRLCATERTDMNGGAMLRAGFRCTRRFRFSQADARATMEGRLTRRCVGYRIDGET